MRAAEAGNVRAASRQSESCKPSRTRLTVNIQCHHRQRWGGVRNSEECKSNSERCKPSRVRLTVTGQSQHRQRWGGVRNSEECKSHSERRKPCEQGAVLA